MPTSARVVILFFACLLSLSADTVTQEAPSYGFWATYAGMIFVLVAALVSVLRGLRHWSLAAALTDDASVGGTKPSISRLIALIGFVVLLAIYLGIGFSVVFRILSGANVQDLSGLGSFLLGAAALFTPYLANQIKAAVVGVTSGQGAAASSTASTVASISPKPVPSGAPQQITVTGTNLMQVQSAICTLEDGSESPISSANVNILNTGAVQVTVTMPAPKTAGGSYNSTLTLINSSGQRIAAGQYPVAAA